MKLNKKIKEPLGFFKRTFTHKKKKKIGLVLGSGGAKGFAHLGVLKILEKERIQIDMISGSSIGAIIGAFYCLYKNTKTIEKITNGFDLKKYLDLGIPRSGLIKGNKLESFLKKNLNNAKFEELAIPLFINATDLNNGEEVIFNSGDLTKAIRASSSIPGLFYPVENKKRILIDGGITNPLPVEVLKRNGCDIIIAVNLVPKKIPKVKYESATLTKNNKKLPNILDISTKTEEIIEKGLSKGKINSKQIDVLIEPKVSSKDFLNFKKQKELILAGEKATIKKIKKIKRLSEK